MEHGKMYIHTQTLFYRTLTNRQQNFDKRRGSDASAGKMTIKTTTNIFHTQTKQQKKQSTLV